jgi:hypothetical protein
MPLLPLVSDSEVEPFEGAPFAAGVLEAAAGAVRSTAGWHIAPEVTETLTVESHGGTRLVLPTMYVTAITAVRHVAEDGTETELTTFRWRPEGVLIRSCDWPCGAIEVDLTHGYEECPPELWPIVAAEARKASSDKRVRSISRGPFSESYFDDSVDPTLARYSLPPRP